MKSINQYYDRQLTREEILKGEHRNFVGGLWSEIGQLQLLFLQEHGLLPQHKLLDIGCGALRCGVPIIRYLDASNYYGVDINTSLLEAGKYELDGEGLGNKQPHLLVSDNFELNRFGESFDFVIAQSLFTHLDKTRIVGCLKAAKGVLSPGGKFFATFFLAPSPGHLSPITQQPGGVVTNHDADPFHYSFSEIERMADLSGMSAQLIGDWNHPRNQKMVQLTHQ